MEAFRDPVRIQRLIDQRETFFEIAVVDDQATVCLFHYFTKSDRKTTAEAIAAEMKVLTDWTSEEGLKSVELMATGIKAMQDGSYTNKGIIVVCQFIKVIYGVCIN